jgi:hypothetical protein
MLLFVFSSLLWANQPSTLFAQSVGEENTPVTASLIGALPLNPQVASFPFADDFEAGIGANWSANSTGAGRAEINTENPHGGTNAVFLGKHLKQDAAASLVLTVNLANQSDVWLNFWWRATKTANDSDNGVYISDNDGATWTKVANLGGNAQFYMRGLINISAAAANRGLTLNDHFLISFYYESRYYDDIGGLLVDDVQLTTRPQVVTTFPASDTVESTAFGQGLYPAGRDSGVVQISNENPFSGDYHFFLGKKTGGDAGAFLTWVVDLAGKNDVFLDFWWRAIGTANSSTNGVYLSVDDGTTWYNIRVLNANRQFYGRELINIYDAASDLGLTLNNRVRIDFHYDSRYYDAIGGLQIDDLRLTTRTEIVVSPPTSEAFATTAFGKGFYPVGSGAGVVEVSDEASYSAPYNVFVGKKIGGDAGVSLHWVVDLANQPSVFLDFWWRATGTANATANGVYISVDDEATWTKIYNLNGNSQSYNHVIINLAKQASDRGLTLNNRVRISFHYTSRYYDPIGGLRLDDLRIGTQDPGAVTPTPITPTPITPTPTSTPNPNQRPPTISEVRPNQGNTTEAGDIYVYGQNFASGAVVRLNTTTLATTFIAATHLQAIVPAGLAAGAYAVTVTNPDGQSATLPNGYRVIDVATNDDLTSSNQQLWTEPVALHAGAPAKIGLLVKRQGGKQTLQNVVVRFYLGNPESGGTLIGDASVDLFSPRSEQSVTLLWTPPAAGAYTIFADIDPNNVVTETFEDNNRFRRTINVLSARPDQEAPHVDSFTINNGATSTTDQQVRLTTTATDRGTPASGLHKVLYLEYEYSSSAQQWVQVQSSGWLDFASASSAYPWLLIPASGMKYLQAWVADKAGNVSLFPAARFINFLPTVQSIGLNQRKVFRYALTAGQTLSARLEAISGDPDLYIWSPEDGDAPWVSNLSTGVDDYTITADVTGNYQVEVYGFSAAQYRLIVTVSAATDLVVGASTTGGIDPNKPQPATPPVGHEAAPNNQIAVTAPGGAQTQLFFPVVRR